jgi:ADP-ribose pyrophosphatase
MTESLKNKQGLTEAEFLRQYDAALYERPSVTVDILLFTVQNHQPENYRKLAQKELKILLIKRGDHPFLGQWALPGGFINMDESLDAAALHELKTETSVENVYLEQLYAWGEPDRDPRTRVISSSYIALVDSAQLKVKAGDDAVDAGWFTVKRSLIEEHKMITPGGYILQQTYSIQLFSVQATLSAKLKLIKATEGKVTQYKREIIESPGIAFDHAMILDYAIERLRNKAEYTDIVFNLMPEYFTLTELQQVYEVILDKELLKANFRRKILDMVIETDRWTSDEGHRPAQLFRKNQ